LAEKIRTWTDERWQYYENEQSAELLNKITGKYLFYSAVREYLEDVAIEEVGYDGFPQAIISVKKIGGDHVLCLLDVDDSRVEELASDYGGYQEVRYCRWKSDVDTHAGKYSERFLQHLDQKTIEKITTPDYAKIEADLEREKQVMSNCSGNRKLIRWEDSPVWKEHQAKDKKGLPLYCPRCSNVLYQKGKRIYCKSCPAPGDEGSSRISDPSMGSRIPQ
jgi:hypothetical protein